MIRRRALLAVFALLPLLAGCTGELPRRLFLTADQRGERLFARGEYAEAAAVFVDPMWKGVALYRAQRFEQALEQFARVDTADAWFARGNALAQIERYEDAVAAYERVLELRPGDAAATANLDYLQPFLPLEFSGGVTGTEGRDAAADEVVYDADAERTAEEGRDTEVEGGLLSEEQIADLWLQQVDASPAAFLRAKFRAQVERGDE